MVQGCRRIIAAAFALMLFGCSSGPPPKLFLLNLDGPPPAGQTSELTGRSPLPAASIGRGATAAEVTVTVPQYLARPEIMVRTDNYEMKALENARWAEDLPVTASRTVANKLAALLPGYDVVAWPSRLERPVGAQVHVDLSKFEADPSGTIEIVGRWAIIDSASDALRSSAHFRYSATAVGVEPRQIAATMSLLLGNVAAEIAPALQRPPTPTGPRAAAPAAPR